MLGIQLFHLFHCNILVLVLIGLGSLISGCHPERSESLRLMNKGIQAFNSGHSQKAVKYLKRAGRADPTNDRAFFYQGDILNQMGMRSENPEYYRNAIKPLQSALKILPNDASIHYELGVAYAGSDQIEKAIQHFDRTFEIDEHQGQSQYRKGQLLEQNERYNEAQEAYYRTIRAKPSIINAYFQLNRLYFRFLRCVAPYGSTITIGSPAPA